MSLLGGGAYCSYLIGIIRWKVGWGMNTAVRVGFFGLGVLLLSMLLWRKCSFRGLVERTGLMIFLSFGLSGIITYFSSEEEKGILDVLGCGFLFLLGGMYLSMKLRQEKKLDREIYIRYRNKSLSGRAWWDTGNALIEPITGKMVYLCDTEWGLGIFPAALREGAEKWIREGIPPGIECGIRICVIPFSSVGKSKGLLRAIVVEEIGVKGSWKFWEKRKDCILAFALQGLPNGKKRTGINMILPKDWDCSENNKQGRKDG